MEFPKLTHLHHHQLYFYRNTTCSTQICVTALTDFRTLPSSPFPAQTNHFDRAPSIDRRTLLVVSHGSLTHIFAQIKEPDQHFSQMRNRALTRLYSCNGAISSAQPLIYAIRIAVWARMFHNFHFQWRLGKCPFRNI